MEKTSKMYQYSMKEIKKNAVPWKKHRKCINTTFKKHQIILSNRFSNDFFFALFHKPLVNYRCYSSRILV